MAEECVKVVGMWASPFVARVEMALRLKGVTYEYIREDLANKSEMLLRYNPVTKKVPVLVHGGKPMAESAVIVEYIDEVWKDGYTIMPADPYERAQARFWARYADEKCNPAIYLVYTSAIGEGQTKLVHEAQQCLKPLQKALEGKKFFCGDAVGYLDIVVGWYARWVPIIEELSATSIVTDQELPLIKAWFDRILAVDVVRETLPPRDKLLPLCKVRREQLLSA
ncbi:glutathione transferase GST 23-like [Lolium rigidum]|uniref:glutathione transferase GST 23-like n=1 Tax=Lolium rigidum TaxID=89674 RepID=UPI001F5CB1A4|nr:glutathione transferase GST 23-like [Lolium rigidum]